MFYYEKRRFFSQSIANNHKYLCDDADGDGDDDENVMLLRLYIYTYTYTNKLIFTKELFVAFLAIFLI